MNSVELRATLTKTIDETSPTFLSALRGKDFPVEQNYFRGSNGERLTISQSASRSFTFILPSYQ